MWILCLRGIDSDTLSWPIHPYSFGHSLQQELEAQELSLCFDGPAFDINHQELAPFFFQTHISLVLKKNYLFRIKSILFSLAAINLAFRGFEAIGFSGAPRKNCTFASGNIPTLPYKDIWYYKVVGVWRGEIGVIDSAPATLLYTSHSGRYPLAE